MAAVPQVGIDGAGNLCAYHVYAWHEAIKDVPGARFESRTAVKHWRLPPTPGAAATLLTILAESGAKVSTRAAELAREGFGRTDARDRAADESIPLPRLPWGDWLKTSPWPHQQRAISFTLDMSAALLAIPMGGGKSLCVVGCMNALDVTRVLIVAPASVFGVWPRELRLHSAREWHVENGQRRSRTGSIKRLSLEERWAEQTTALTLCGCGKPHAVVVGYEAMTRDPLASADLAALGVEAVIFDEAHRLKSAGGSASWTAKSWVSQVPRRIALTGTPIPQNPDDVYGLFRALDPSVFGTNKTVFRAKFIKTVEKDGRSWPVDVHPHARAEFSRLFHSITYLPTVDLKLPPVTHTVRGFELEPAARKMYEQIRDQGVAEITAAVVAAGGTANPGDGERTVAPANAGVELLRLAQITGGSVVDDDGRASVVSRAKQQALGKVSRGRLVDGILHEVACVPGGRDGKSRPEPVVVFCRFRADLAAVQELAGQAGLRYAEISGERKDGLTDESKMSPDCDLLGVQIASGGVGIDLTRARVYCYWSTGFERWLFDQSQARVNRPGQTRLTQAFYLIAESTVDGAIYAALARRQQVIDAVVHEYLRGNAERGSAELPPMEAPEGSVAGERPGVPEWLMPDAPPRKPADPEADAQAAALAMAGLSGF